MVKNELSKGIDIELGEEMAEGQYANMVVIAHSTSEFVLDFVRIMPGLPKARVKSRIVLAPERRKRTAAIRRRLRRPSRKKAMFRPRAVAKRLPGGLSSAAEIRRHINGTVST